MQRIELNRIQPHGFGFEMDILLFIRARSSVFIVLLFYSFHIAVSCGVVLADRCFVHLLPFFSPSFLPFALVFPAMAH